MGDLSRRRTEEDSFLEEDGKIADLYWKELKAMDPADVCRRSLAGYDEEGKAYELRMLNDDLLVYPEKRTLERISQPVSET
ncbi:MAG: hypothetical protein JSV16_05575, partial [Candidatus Hydrogenedentota bacterium]